jgi:hypothetical protein
MINRGFRNKGDSLHVFMNLKNPARFGFTEDLLCLFLSASGILVAQKIEFISPRIPNASNAL